MQVRDEGVTGSEARRPRDAAAAAAAASNDEADVALTFCTDCDTCLAARCSPDAELLPIFCRCNSHSY